ncbi:MAG: tetratricopeptide repeat protein [Candidatus Latescibacteria bacterium]|nr:tetratricopeptide repeat protein [bacterium]MBD3424106.1 tetratricopeptide repeat protein [Candidatus Latescibacterota bacterium]
MDSDLKEEFRQLLERFEEAPRSRLFAPVADMYRKTGDLDRAVEICNQGLEIYPDYVSARVILGKCFYDKGASERAKTEFERVLELDSENMVALKFLGDICLAEDRRDKAADYYRELLEIDPTNDRIRDIYEELTEEFDPPEIDLEKSESVESLVDENEPATMTLAGIYASQGYYQKAVDIYRSILAEQPENEEARKMLARVENKLSETDREREEAFDSEVMTISLDDISEDIVENTSGTGASDTEQREEEREVAPEGEEAPPEGEESSEESAPDEDEGPGPQGMDDFLGWVRKVKGKSEDNE